MTCATCGTETPADFDSCPSCGVQFGTSTPTTFSPTSISEAATVLPVPVATISVTELPTRGPAVGTPVSGAQAATAGPLRLGQEFGPRYRVLKLLGIGGMGAVYKAWDEELGMAVALKVIRSDHTRGDAAGESERRFKRELVLARQVTHKNVIRIHDLGEQDGIKYITMPYVEGADLAKVIGQQGKLPIARALEFARQIAGGLRAAHDVGVVHRDLKPANILIGGDTALITDFGIAHSLSAPAEASAGIVGTVRYMAPEQARGGVVDHRADIYAFGLIFCEMLSGKGMTAGTNTLDVLNERASPSSAAVPSLAPEIPESVAAIVTRCLQPDAEARYRSVADLLSDLDRLDDAGNLLPAPRVFTIPEAWPLIGGKVIARSTAAAWLVLVLAVPLASAVAFVSSSWLNPAAPVAHEPVPVLIADFENQTGDGIFDGIVEQALGVALEGASFITAYPRSDAQRLVQQIAPGKRLDVERARVIAQREGIKVVLAGAIAPAGSRYRVTVNSVDPVPGNTLSTVSAIASSKDDVLSVIGRLGSDLRTALGDTTPSSARLAERETFTAASTEAAGIYLKAQDLLNNGKHAESVPYFRRATELDPTFARAYVGWAVAAFYLGRREETETLYRRAFALSDRMTEREKYRTYGAYYLTVAQAYDQAIENYSKLVELYPADSVGHGNLAVAYFYRLNLPKAFEEGRRALALYPASPKLRGNYALYAMYASDFATAAREAEQLLKTDPTYYQAYIPLATAALDQSAIPAARAAYERMASLGALGASRAAIGLTDIELYQGRHAAAAAVVVPAIQVDEKNGNRIAMATKYIALAEARLAEGRPADAAAAVRRALEVSRHESIMLPAARVQISLGHEGEARSFATELNSEIGGYGRPYARLVEAELALRRGDTAEAVEHLNAGLKITDLWLLHFGLGQVYVQAGRYPEALAELELCLKRRGEATAVFLDDVPSFRYLAQLPYWLGRAQEGVGVVAQATENYRRFLALRQPSPRDELATDSRHRLARLGA
jgi:tetratricopeptide (TPR) repeat protein/predicted Ser/Thr protein kinase